MNEDFIHEIIVTEITKEKERNNLKDVVVHCRWCLKSYHKDYPEEIENFVGAIPLPINEEELQNSFVKFNDLTNDIVVSWIKKHSVNIPMLKKRNQEILKKRIFKSNELIIKNPFTDIFEPLSEPSQDT